MNTWRPACTVFQWRAARASSLRSRSRSGSSWSRGSYGSLQRFPGVHHFGFVVEDLPASRDTLYYERKYRDPDGIIFDISHHGWGVGGAGEAPAA